MARATHVFASFKELSDYLVVLTVGDQHQQTSSAILQFSKVVMPAKPPIDKTASLALVDRRMSEPVEEIVFWGSPKCESSQLEMWMGKGILPIDLGEEKYNKHQEVGSAAEFLAKKLQFDLKSSERALLVMLGENNRSGKLKGYHMSAARTLRELY